MLFSVKDIPRFRIYRLWVTIPIVTRPVMIGIATHN
jgi:hypothetical protein